MHTAYLPSERLAYADFRAYEPATLHCDAIEHVIDHKPLPPIAPRTGQSPQRLLNAVMSGDLYALSRELTSPTGVPVNDRIPGMKGRTMLHVVARMYALRAGGWCAADRDAALVLDQMVAALLAAGADPCARDRDYELASAYTEGRTPPALLRRMEREASDAKFEDVGVERQRIRVNATHPKNRRGQCARARAHAYATGEISGAVGDHTRKAIHRTKQGHKS